MPLRIFNRASCTVNSCSLSVLRLFTQCILLIQFSSSNIHRYTYQCEKIMLRVGFSSFDVMNSLMAFPCHLHTLYFKKSITLQGSQRSQNDFPFHINMRSTLTEKGKFLLSNKKLIESHKNVTPVKKDVAINHIHLLII